MKKIILIMLLLVGLSYGQAGIFGTTDVPRDTVTITDATEVESQLIIFNAYPEGVGTLFIAGDTTSGAGIGYIGYYQNYYGNNVAGDSLWGIKTAFADSVLQDSDLDNGAYDSGTMTGREIDLGAIWNLGIGVKFFFVGSGTQTAILCSYIFFY